MTRLAPSSKSLTRERWNLIVTLETALDKPMIVLSFIWLLLTILDISFGLVPILQHAVNIIWVIFGLHFLSGFFLAPSKRVYLKHNWLTAISLLLPAFRILRVAKLFRGLRFIRGSYFVRIFSSINRGMKSLSKNLGKRGILYVLGLSLMVISLSAAGIMNFERGQSTDFVDYGTSFWWACMMVTTMGADFFPQSPEGRILSLLLAIYGFAVFGYVTATVATFFLEKDQASASEKKFSEEISLLYQEIKKLRELVENQKKLP